MKKTILSVAAAIMMFAACKSTKHAGTTETKPATPKVDCGMPAPTYAGDIKNIIEANCTKCHGEGGKGGYNLKSLDDLHRAGKNGDLVGVIKWSPGFAKMPAHAEQLDAKTIASIECWVNNGMN